MRRTLIAILLLFMIIGVGVKAAPAMTTKDDRQKRKELTPLSHVQMIRSLRDSHITFFNERPNNRRLASAWAQVALENGRGKFVWNHNLGNIGPTRNNARSMWYMHSPGVKYRAFEGYHDGGLAYWTVLARCSSALKAFDTGSMTVASEQLKHCNYYSTTVEHYVRGMTTLYWHAMNDVIPLEIVEAKNAGQD